MCFKDDFQVDFDIQFVFFMIGKKLLIDFEIIILGIIFYFVRIIVVFLKNQLVIRKKYLKIMFIYSYIL